MTPDQVRMEVDAIRAIAGDYERAHDAEDDLWRRVLEAIRGGAVSPESLAEQALKTTAIKFERWCA